MIFVKNDSVSKVLDQYSAFNKIMLDILYPSQAESNIEIF